MYFEADADLPRRLRQLSRRRFPNWEVKKMKSFEMCGQRSSHAEDEIRLLNVLVSQLSALFLAMTSRSTRMFAFTKDEE